MTATVEPSRSRSHLTGPSETAVETVNTAVALRYTSACLLTVISVSSIAMSHEVLRGNIALALFSGICVPLGATLVCIAQVFSPSSARSNVSGFLRWIGVLAAAVIVAVGALYTAFAIFPNAPAQQLINFSVSTAIPVALVALSFTAAVSVPHRWWLRAIAVSAVFALATMLVTMAHTSNALGLLLLAAALFTTGLWFAAPRLKDHR